MNIVKLPCPRFEFLWTQVNGWKERQCEYSLVIPLGEYDIRRDREGLSNQDELKLPIGKTKCSGGDGGPPIHSGKVSTPFRDCAHAQWDCRSLGGHIPIVAICGDVVSIVPLNRDESR